MHLAEASRVGKLATTLVPPMSTRQHPSTMQDGVVLPETGSQRKRHQSNNRWQVKAYRLGNASGNVTLAS